MSRALFTRGQANAKTRKALGMGVDTLILHLAPARVAGVGDVCTSSTPGCRALCLNTAGRGGMWSKTTGQLLPSAQRIQRARVERTRAYFANASRFLDQLSHEIDLAKRRARPFAVRVNGTSDLPKVAMELARRHPDVQFYDYTKHARAWFRQRANYHLTFSRSETNDAECFDALAHGVNVAVVFDTPRGGTLPRTYYGVPVIDGDTSDLRYLDSRGVVVGLRAKGKARRDRSGFVVPVASLPASDRS